MIQILFLLFLFLLGLIFGLSFKKWIPVKFIIFSSFLWGSLLYSITFYIIYMAGLKVTPSIFILILSILLIGALSFCIKTWNKGLQKNEWLTIVFVLINFFLINLIFLQFNYSLTTYDSFTFINLARSMGFDGFSNSVIQTLLSWGGLISIIQSAGIHLGFDYLVTLQFSFSLSFIALFFYICEKLSSDLVQNVNLSKAIALISTFVVISTPLIVIQFFYIHSNLTTALFLFLAAYCGWMAIKDNNNIWFVFFNLSMVGLILSRTETFIYALIIIIVLLISNKLDYRQRLLAFLPVLSAQTIWFVYVFARLSNGINVLNLQIAELFNGTKNLNSQKIQLVIIFMLAIVCLIIFSRSKILTIKIFPILNKYFLSISFLFLVFLVILKPAHMERSIDFFGRNLFFAGEWGLSFWLISIFLIVLIFNHRLPVENYLINIFASTTIIIIALSFLRNPFRLGWPDSANRLMTFGIPIGFLFVAITFSRWLKSRTSSLEIE